VFSNPARHAARHCGSTGPTARHPAQRPARSRPDGGHGDWHPAPCSTRGHTPERAPLCGPFPRRRRPPPNRPPPQALAPAHLARDGGAPDVNADGRVSCTISHPLPAPSPPRNQLRPSPGVPARHSTRRPPWLPAPPDGPVVREPHVTTWTDCRE